MFRFYAKMCQRVSLSSSGLVHTSLVLTPTLLESGKAGEES